MRYLLVMIFIVSVALAGCTGGRVYTFQKDRVDQSVDGNRGYLMGDAPPVTVRGSSKRTMIGMDIEVGLLPGEKAKVSPREALTFGEGDVIEERMMIEEEFQPEAKKTKIAPKSEKPEEWIK